MEGMCHSNNIMVIQTSQLGQIENLEDEVHVLKEKVVVQDMVVSNLISNNLDHLQANMQLTAHINRSEARWVANEWHLQYLEEMIVAMLGEESAPGILGSGGDNKDGLDGDEDRGDSGASIQESVRPPTPALRERGLIKEMEEEAREAGLGGWYNREDQDVFTESWSGPNSDMLASQDHVRKMHPKL